MIYLAKSIVDFKAIISNPLLEILFFICHVLVYYWIGLIKNVTDY